MEFDERCRQARARECVERRWNSARVWVCVYTEEQAGRKLTPALWPKESFISACKRARREKVWKWKRGADKGIEEERGTEREKEWIAWQLYEQFSGFSAKKWFQKDKKKNFFWGTPLKEGFSLSVCHTIHEKTFEHRKTVLWQFYTHINFSYGNLTWGKWTKSGQWWLTNSKLLKVTTKNSTKKAI